MICKYICISYSEKSIKNTTKMKRKWTMTQKNTQFDGDLFDDIQAATIVAKVETSSLMKRIEELEADNRTLSKELEKSSMELDKALETLHMLSKEATDLLRVERTEKAEIAQLRAKTAQNVVLNAENQKNIHFLRLQLEIARRGQSTLRRSNAQYKRVNTQLKEDLKATDYSLFLSEQEHTLNECKPDLRMAAKIVATTQR
jgi:chromosome segregation ATPase